MPSNFLKDDPFSGAVDLDQEYITDAWLVDQFVGNQVFSMGRNSGGQLGLGDIVHRSSPVQVGALTNWKQVSASMGWSNSVAVKTDGTLWSWGGNDSGALGLGDLTHRSSPVQVGALTDWKQVASGFQSGFAIKNNGTLWSWGNNSFGQLGQGNTVHRSSPVQVGALTDWKSVVSGDSTTIAIKTNGTLWAWGENNYGQLGLGDITSRNSPVQVGSLTNWSQVSIGEEHVLAIKTDGTLWGWGRNSSGQLGLGDLVPRSSPVQVGSLNNWKQVSAGYGFYGFPEGVGGHSLAVKSDGTLWAWGANNNGELGIGTVYDTRSSPVQVGSLTDWKSVSCGYAGTNAIKNNGTLWSWGITYTVGAALYSSPVQVGSLTNWKQISSGGQIGAEYSLAITYNDIT